MQLSYTFSALALSILAMANLGLTTPLAAVSNYAYPCRAPQLMYLQPSADGTAAVATDEVRGAALPLFTLEAC